MAKYTIHSVDGGYVPPLERVDYYGGTLPYPGLGLVWNESSNRCEDGAGNSNCDYVCMCTRTAEEMGYDSSNDAYTGEVLAIRVSPNIVFEDEDGNRVRLK